MLPVHYKADSIPWYVENPDKPLKASEKTEVLVVPAVKVKGTKWAFPELRIRIKDGADDQKDPN